MKSLAILRRVKISQQAIPMSELDIKTAGAWCWQSKEIRKAIRVQAGDNHTLKRDALAVYCALTEIASDKQSSTFNVTHAILFDRSGVSVAQIKLVLNFLRAHHFVSWVTSDMGGPCTYTLLSFHIARVAQPELPQFPQSHPSHGEATLAMGLNQGETATPEERIEEREKNPEKNIPPIVPQGGPKEEIQLLPSPPPELKTPIQLRIEALFRRRASTVWGKSEKKAWASNCKAVEATAEEDLHLLEARFSDPAQAQYRRRDLATLLNNWNAEIDRARQFASNPEKKRLTMADVKNFTYDKF